MEGVKANRIHPVHAVLLAASLPLFLGTLLSDLAYWRTQEVQWINFASWLIASALVFAGLTLLWAAINFVRADVRHDRLWWVYILALLATFALGMVDALVHGKDGWATMPEGLILSAAVSLLGLASVAIGFSTLFRRAER
jgi:uncharacterized membrane protein